MAAAPPPVLRRVADVAAEFGVGLDAVTAYARSNGRSVSQLWGSHTADGDRYIVVAVDTAGGGRRSDEAFAVFLVVGGEFALLSARLAVGHDRRIPFSTVPLVFVLSLLETVRTVRRMLAADLPPSAALDAVPVLVVIESNFAYGAALYLQLLQLVRQRQLRHADLRSTRLIFASAVYTLDWRRAALLAERDDAQRTLDTVALPARATLEATMDAAWQSKGPRRHGLNRATVLRDAREAVRAQGLNLLGPRVLDPATTEAQVADVLRAVLRRLPPGDEARTELLTVWASDFAGAVQAHLLAANRVDVLRATIARLNAQADAANRGGEGGMHPFVTARPWPSAVNTGDAPPHRMPSVKNGQDGSLPPGGGPPGAPAVSYPPGRFWDAGKRTFGEWTSRAEKVRAFRHFAHLLHGGSSRPPRPGRVVRKKRRGKTLRGRQPARDWCSVPGHHPHTGLPRATVWHLSLPLAVTPRRYGCPPGPVPICRRPMWCCTVYGSSGGAWMSA